MIDIIIVISFSYIFGSIPFGLILTKIFGNLDIRKIGSGNIGATNVLRSGNKLLAVITLLLDVLKVSDAYKFFESWNMVAYFKRTVLLVLCKDPGRNFPVKLQNEIT